MNDLQTWNQTQNPNTLCGTRFSVHFNQCKKVLVNTFIDGIHLSKTKLLASLSAHTPALISHFNRNQSWSKQQMKSPRDQKLLVTAAAMTAVTQVLPVRCWIYSRRSRGKFRTGFISPNFKHFTEVSVGRCKHLQQATQSSLSLSAWWKCVQKENQATSTPLH